MTPDRDLLTNFKDQEIEYMYVSSGATSRDKYMRTLVAVCENPEKQL